MDMQCGLTSEFQKQRCCIGVWPHWSHSRLFPNCLNQLSFTHGQEVIAHLPVETLAVATLAEVVTTPRSACAQAILRFCASRVGTNLKGSAPRKRTSEYSSPTRFCSGVPDKHHLYWASSEKAALAALVERSLILCASSRITLRVRQLEGQD